MWKQLIASYFSFSKKERRGIFVLVFLILCFAVLPFVYTVFVPQKNYDHQEFEQAIASLRIRQADSSEDVKEKGFNRPDYRRYYPTASREYPDAPVQKAALFKFDPNTATAGEWKRLGLREKTIATIQNYLAKGGRFSRQEDIGKIWGLHPDEVARLLPYVQIRETAPPPGTNTRQYERTPYKRPNALASIEINSADTAALISLPGIGAKLSQRIIGFRDKLGGFYKIEQVGETFGLPDSTFQKIRPYMKLDESNIKRININTASNEDMKAHPYIRYALANGIVQYRQQHGSFASVADIKKIMLVTDEIFNKAAPYLTVN